MDSLPHKGSSMWPAICDGDQVHLQYFEKPVTIKDCSLGQVVLHRDHKEWVLHRVVRINGRLVFKGDFSNSYFFTSDQVVWGAAKESVTNRWIARLSARAYMANGSRRKMIKFLIYVLAKFQRLFFAKKYLQPEING